MMLELSHALNRDLLSYVRRRKIKTLRRREEKILLKIDSRVKFNVGQDERTIDSAFLRKHFFSSKNNLFPYVDILFSHRLAYAATHWKLAPIWIVNC